MEETPSPTHKQDATRYEPDESSVLKRPKADIGTLLLCLLIFSTAVSVRLMHWQDIHGEHPLAGMEATKMARTLLGGQFGMLLHGANPPNDAGVLVRAPGYIIFEAAVLKLFGDSEARMRLIQILCDALASVLVFFLSAKLFFVKAVPPIAGLLVALSPQLASYSFVLIPDPLAALPILTGMYVFTKLIERPRLIIAASAGALIGLSLWLRPNTLLLSPFLGVLVVFLGRRRDAVVLVGTTLLVMAPITIRNWIFFHRFIPVTLGAGVTLVEGIGAYDKEKRFGLAASDMGVCRMEAVWYNRPDYTYRLLQGGASTLVPDGIAREDERLRRGFAVIRSHPFWFSGVMIRRAVRMLDLERMLAVNAEPSGTHALTNADGVPPAWSGSPAELAASLSIQSPGTRVMLTARDETLRLESSNFRWGDQLVLPPIPVEKNTDYLLRMPAKVERDGMAITVKSVNHGDVLASTNIYQWVETPPSEQPVNVVQIPFVSRDTTEVQIVFGDFNKRETKPIVEIGHIEFFKLGSASLLWTRFPRFLVRTVQKFFLMVTVLPLAVLGAGLLVHARQKRALIIVLAVPAYYLFFQAPLLTDYRYVLPIYYFIFMLAAVAIAWISKRMWHSGCSLARFIRTRITQ